MSSTSSSKRDASSAQLPAYSYSKEEEEDDIIEPAEPIDPLYKKLKLEAVPYIPFKTAASNVMEVSRVKYESKIKQSKLLLEEKQNEKIIITETVAKTQDELDKMKMDILAMDDEIAQLNKELLRSKGLYTDKRTTAAAAASSSSSTIKPVESIRWSSVKKKRQSTCTCANCSNATTTESCIEYHFNDSTKIETGYQAYLQNVATTTTTNVLMPFTTQDGTSSLILDFSNMKTWISGYTSDKFELVRTVYKNGEVPDSMNKDYCAKVAKHPDSFISLDTASLLPPDSDHHLVDVELGVDSEIEDFFLKTMTTSLSKKWKIDSVQRHVHPAQAHMYNTQKKLMQESSPTKDEPQELMLFHANRSGDNDIILSGGLDMRFSGMGMSGKAVYFADNAWFSHNRYGGGISGANEMFIVRVLAGKEYEGPGQRYNGTEAPKDHHSVWHQQYPTYVGAVYDNSQCYISHFIRYSPA